MFKNLKREDVSGLMFLKNGACSIRRMRKASLGLGLLIALFLALSLPETIFNEGSFRNNIYWWTTTVISLLFFTFLMLSPRYDFHIKHPDHYYLVSMIFNCYAILQWALFVTVDVFASNEKLMLLRIASIGIMLLVFIVGLIKKLHYLRSGKYRDGSVLYKKMQTKYHMKEENRAKSLGIFFDLNAVLLIIVLKVTQENYNVLFHGLLLVAMLLIALKYSYNFSDDILVAFCRYKFEDFRTPDLSPKKIHKTLY